MSKTNEKTKYHSYQVPGHLYGYLAAEAAERRKKTGELVGWSDILREVLEKWVAKK